MTMTLRRGRRLGKYRLERRLGDGGSAVVWQARDTIEGRWVAAKIVLPSVVTEYGREAVEAEARIGASLDHPRVARVLNADWIENLFVIVSDLAKTSLDHAVAVRRSPNRILSAVMDVAEGLAYAHEHGVIHRDIKPANILLFDDRRARLSDFGTARLGQSRTRVVTEAGTMGYMAPEQAYGRPRFASDVFGLGLTAYELWAGVLPGWPFEWPLDGPGRFEERCPSQVQPVIRRALALNLQRRYENGVEFYEALQKAVEKIEQDAAAALRVTGRRKQVGPAPKHADPFDLEAGWFRKRYGKLLGARYDCHACDGPISESMRHCPWCGTTRNSFAEITSFPLVCPQCERGVRPEWGACPTCSKGRFEANGHAIPDRSTADRICKHSSCGAPIQRFMHYCPGCKDRVARPWRVEGLKGCQRCDWPMVPRWRFCAWCGRRNARAMIVRSSER